MFIATVSYGLAVSVPCGEDAERAVNSTGPGEKGLRAPARLHMGTWEWPWGHLRAPPRAVPHAGGALAPYVPHEGRSGGGSGPSLLRSR